jgi:hypothetical protein
VEKYAILSIGANNNISSELRASGNVGVIY